MHIDVLLDPFGTRWSDLRDTARAAAEAGFVGVWTWDHLDGHVYDAPDVLECWTVLSALAAAVPNVMIGPLVLNVANRRPGVLAVMAATLQDVAGGRLLLGLGAGGGPGTPYQREQEATGGSVAADPVRRAQIETCVEQLRRVWRLPGFLEPDPAPPVVIGAFGPKMAELAGRVGDGINTRAADPRVEEIVTIARVAHERAGRDPARFLVTVFTALDEAWLTIDSERRRHLDAIGVNRLILYVRPADDRARLVAAGRMATRVHRAEPD